MWWQRPIFLLSLLLLFRCIVFASFIESPILLYTEIISPPDELFF